MRQVTLAGLKAHKSRLVAVSLAVILAVAFMSATLLLASSTKATLKASLGAEVQHADLIVTPNDAAGEGVWIPFTQDLVSEIEALPEVEVLGGPRFIGAGLKSDTREIPYVSISSPLPVELSSVTLAEGTLPAEAGEIVIDAESMKLLGLKLGDQLTMLLQDVQGGEHEQQQTVVGVSQPSANPFNGGMASALIPEEALVKASSITGQEEILIYGTILVKLAPGFTQSDFISALESIKFVDQFDNVTGTPLVQSPDEIVADQVEMFTQGSDILTGVLMAFVVVALFVAGLVISNTFSVLVAQRSRELALLRCVGASSKQVKSSVLTEALIMSLVASAIGVLLAIGIMSGLVWLGDIFNIGGGVGVFGLGWEAIVLPIIAGVIVTLIAANGPAREATRVAPLEALRSREAESVTKRAGAVRMVFGLLFLITGAALITLGVIQSAEESVIALALTVLGSLVSAVGVLMLLVFVVPPATYGLGRLLFAKGVPGKLAALNTIRNPKRTAATASALLIGVTLVSTVYTGAEVARATFDRELSSAFPIDLTVFKLFDDEILLEEDLERLRDIDGVESVAGAVQSFYIEPNETGIHTLWGVSPDDFAAVTSDQKVTLEEGKALLGNALADNQTEITLTGDVGALTFAGVKEGAPRDTAIVTPQDFVQVSVDHGTQIALIKVASGLSTTELFELREEIASLIPMSYVTGEGLERAMFDDVISMLLLIVTALLAVAVIIAVIGIGNTLSLSVIERTRENALLRALGLTKAQLRGMLASEALLTALTAALLGAGLGVVYGFAGASAVLAPLGGVALDVPWAAIGIILVSAIVAGLLASVLPARRATKLSPVEGLRGV